MENKINQAAAAKKAKSEPGIASGQTKKQRLGEETTSQKPAEPMPTERLLYPNSRVTIKDFLPRLQALQREHNLSNDCMNDLLTLTKMVLPKPNNCPPSYQPKTSK